MADRTATGAASVRAILVVIVLLALGGCADSTIVTLRNTTTQPVQVQLARPHDDGWFDFSPREYEVFMAAGETWSTLDATSRQRHDDYVYARWCGRMLLRARRAPFGWAEFMLDADGPIDRLGPIVIVLVADPERGVSLKVTDRHGEPIEIEFIGPDDEYEYWRESPYDPYDLDDSPWPIERSREDPSTATDDDQ